MIGFIILIIVIIIIVFVISLSQPSEQKELKKQAFIKVDILYKKIHQINLNDNYFSLETPLTVFEEDALTFSTTAIELMNLVNKMKRNELTDNFWKMAELAIKTSDDIRGFINSIESFHEINNQE